MTQVVGILNSLLTRLFDVLLWPLRGLHPIWALLAVSLVTGLIMLWIFGKVSDQDAVRLVRDRIRGNLIGVRLFGDDIRVMFRLQGTILRSTLTYMRYAVLPMLVMLIPVLLILTQLNLNFASRPLKPGEPAVVTVKLRGVPSAARNVELEAPAGVVVETPGVRMDSLKEIAWRIRAERAGDYLLRVKTGNDAVEKQLRVGSGWGGVSSLRTARLLDLLLYPGEPPIDTALPVESIRLSYDYLPIRLFGFHVNWLVGFFLASIVFGFAFRKPFGVEI